MKIVLIVLLAVVAMAASQGVHIVDHDPSQVVDHNPYEVQVVDHNPYEVQVVDRNPLEVQVVDHNPYEVQVVDRNPLEVQVVDHNPYEVQVVDRNPLEVQVVNNNPYVQVVDQPNQDAGNYNHDNLAVDSYFGQKPEGHLVVDPFFGQIPNHGQQYQPINTDPYIVNPPNYRPKEFPPFARDGKN